MTSVVAGLATALFTAWHFQQVSPLSLVANLAAMPIVSVAVMPMAVLASLLMPFGLDAPPLWLMGQGIAAMNAIAFSLAEHSVFDATGAIPLAAVLTLTAALALLTMSESALRWAALPFVVIGVALLVTRQMPEAFVSEDARLVAMRLGDGRIAVNRNRPRGFTMDNWRRGFGGGEIVRPTNDDARRNDSQPGTNNAAGPPAANHAALTADGEFVGETGFVCSGDLCVASRADGAMIVHAQTAAAARVACSFASLIIIADATAEDPCGTGEAATITARRLARQGSAEVVFRGKGKHNSPHPAAAQDVRIRFAIAKPYRPWHEHRQYSRAARGLAPYQPRSRQQTPEAQEPRTVPLTDGAAAQPQMEK